MEGDYKLNIKYMKDLLEFFTVVVIPMGLVLTVLITSMVSVSIHYERVACESFGRESGREVKFAKMAFASYSCMTPSSDGKWISTDMLREITN